MDLVIVILTLWMFTFYLLYYSIGSYTVNIFKTTFISRTFRSYTVSTLLPIIYHALWDPGTLIKLVNITLNYPMEKEQRLDGHTDG